MPRKRKTTGPDEDNPEWTAERIRRAKPFHELPVELQVKLLRKPTEESKPAAEQEVKPPVKQLISVRLSPDVLAALRAKGPGWQSLIDDTLRRQFVPR